ncbi:phosphatase 5 [Pyrrhoderma noxium]|uniref:Serine/threonine-protein phosphatase n=1 Tax=Pyrrhoderma noxium TaxID=2282107 RepID=A0A286UG04_9AGAM|nr:phosphatase 5 [Pyrrhoderma noxium]
MTSSSTTNTGEASSSNSPASSVPQSPSSTASSLATAATSAVSELSLKDVSDKDRETAAALKLEANAAFGKHDFAKAAEIYSKAIELNHTDATLFCNRAYARMKIEEHGYAIGDCTKALELDPKYVKALYRRALCHLQSLKPQLAVADFKKVLKLDPKNALAKSQLEITQKLIRKVEFEKAIEMDEEQDAAERCKEIISEDGCPLETSYAGPKLPSTDGGKTYGITADFLQQMIEWFKDGKTLPRRYVWEIVLGAYNQFIQEESLVELVLEDGVTCDVIGDVHGQYYDYLHLLSLTGHPSEKHCLLMNGDLVDRGSWSIEVILTAFAFKWLYPKRMYINRGNHETKDMNRTYGFEGEAKHKHGEQTYKLFAHVFTALPLATLLTGTLPPKPLPANIPPTALSSKYISQTPILGPSGCKRYFIVHGGLFSRDDVTLEDVRKEKRLGRQPGQEGIMCELLWTDPQELPGRGPSKRGVGIAFGPDVTQRWCEANKVSGVFRSHEVRQDGYAIEHEGLCTTIFSAPNYVDQSGNKGAFIRVDASGECEYVQFEAVPHPPMKPMAYATGMAGMFM